MLFYLQTPENKDFIRKQGVSIDTTHKEIGGNEMAKYHGESEIGEIIGGIIGGIVEEIVIETVDDIFGELFD